MIIFYILATLSLDNVWTLLGENCRWSLLGLKGLKVDGPAGGLNPRPPARQTGSLSTELTGL